MVTAVIKKAAIHINGHTLHSALEISCFFEEDKKRKGQKPFHTDAVYTIQSKWSSVRYLLIDEISTVSEQLFAEVSASKSVNLEVTGRTLFMQLNDIIFLNQQMRQANDMTYYELLQRLCYSKATKQDFETLSS